MNSTSQENEESLRSKLERPLDTPVKRVGAIVFAAGLVCFIVGIWPEVESLAAMYRGNGATFWIRLGETVAEAWSSPWGPAWYYPALTIGLWLTPIGFFTSYGYRRLVSPIVRWIRQGRGGDVSATR